MKQRIASYVLFLVTFVSCLLCVLTSPFVTLPADAQVAKISQGKASASLMTSLLAAARNAQFNQVIDYGPYNEVCPGEMFCPVPAPRVAQMPNVDIAVIQLDKNGGLRDVADVLMSRDYPNGLIVPIDRNYGASSVRWRKWDIERSDGGTFSDQDGSRLTTKGWTNNPPLTAEDDIVPGRASAQYQFMMPYPASLFKLMVAYRLMRLVDAGILSLNQPYTYAATGEETETRQIRLWMDPMITYSDNKSTQALLKLLHDLNQIEAMNAEFRNLGLETLQVNDTDPNTGKGWQPGHIHMTALDTARLLWLIDGAKDNRVLWRRPNGQAVTSAELTNSSRSYLKGLLANQGFHEVLSTSNFCGALNTQAGIPARVPSRWIDPNDGTVTVDGIPYGQDVRPCNAIAEVLFSHKTGLTFNYGSDAGIVHSLPGKPERNYIIALIANLGYRYADPVFAARTSFPCFDAVGGICYTQKIPKLGNQIDKQFR